MATDILKTMVKGDILNCCVIFQMFEIPDLKKVRSAARALLSKDAHKIPLERLNELEDIVRSYFGLEDGDMLTVNMLHEANDILVR